MPRPQIKKMMGLALFGLALALSRLAPADAAPTCRVDTPPPKSPAQLEREEREWGRWVRFEEAFVRLDSASAPTPTYHVLIKRPGAKPDTSKPLVVFLHGFPEFAWSWEHYLALVGQHHDAIAIDLKGFGESSKPSDLAPYQFTRVVSEIDGIAACLGYKQVIPVGHDWGGTFAWMYAMLQPFKTRAVVVMSTPHPYTFFRELAKPDSDQRRRSHYIELVRRNTPESMAEFRALLEPGVQTLLTPFYEGARANRLFQANMDEPWKWDRMVSYYLNMDYPPPAWLFPDKPNLIMRTLMKVRAPTLAFYGTEDPYFAPESWQGVEDFVPKLDFRPLPGQGHFINHQAPGLPQQVLQFLNLHAR